MTEEWRPVLGFEEKYQVSNAGRVRSIERRVTYTDGRVATFPEKVLACCRGNMGYPAVLLSMGRGNGQRALVHRLVAEAFLPRLDGAECVNHKNGDKADNRVENLEWATYAENNNHARNTGLNRQHGEACNLSKYSAQIVAAVRRVHDKYQPTYRELAMLFDISEMHVADICKGRTRLIG